VTTEDDSIPAELSELKKTLLQYERRLRQMERVAEASQQVADQSKRAVLAQNRELEETILELEKARSLADEASAAKSQFLATMSHEIRTPMNGVLGSLDLLRMTSLDEGQRSLVGVMQTSAEHLLTIINDVLDLSKIEAGRMTLERTPFRLSECLEGSLGASRHVAARNGVALNIRISNELPAVVVGDAHRLRQILLNLVGNAVKFTHQGTIDVLVTRGAPGRVAFAVKDTGIGINALALEHIFDAFIQEEHGPMRRYGGTGLGLAICKSLASLMGGDIVVDSVVGQGSTFSFEIDLPAAVLVPARRRPAPRGAEPSELPSMLILVVDDNPVNQLVTRRMLERLGHRVVRAVNGRLALEAVKSVEAGGFDAILMDCSMPVMDGYEAARAIRSLDAVRAATPIIALTAHALNEDRERCFAAGMDDFVSKPVRMADLEAALVRVSKRNAA